jgi:predicted negative regulator of RcsB-dependent stress response
MLIIGNILSALGFIKTPLGKIVSAVVLIIALWAGFQWWLSRHDAGIREEARIEFNQMQEAESARLKKLYDERMKTVLADQAKLAAQLELKNELLQERSDRLLEMIRSGILKGGESSEVLRGTVQMLQERALEGQSND